MIASYNLSDMTYPRSDPRMDRFFDNVDRINDLAERSPGFVWRLKSDPTDGHKEAQLAGTTLTTLSVWENAQALGDFVFKTLHVQFYLDRRNWFDAISRAHFVMWPHLSPDWPTEAEAKNRLAHYEAHGPSEYAHAWEFTDTSRWARLGDLREPARV